MRDLTGASTGDKTPGAKRELAIAVFGQLDVQDVIAASATALRIATATVTAPTSVLPAALTGATLLDMRKCARQLQFTTAGGTPADAPATVKVRGWTQEKFVEETLALAQTATTANTVNYFVSIESIEFAAGDGTAATIAIGITGNLGLPVKLRGRGAAGAVIPILRELVDGAAPTAGGLLAVATNLPFGAYAPNAAAAANGARDHLVLYEIDV